MNEMLMIVVITIYLVIALIKRIRNNSMDYALQAYPPQGKGALFCEKYLGNNITARGILGDIIELCVAGVLRLRKNNGSIDVIKVSEYTGKDAYKKRIISMMFDGNNELVYTEDAIIGYPVYHIRKNKFKSDFKELLKELNIREKSNIALKPPTKDDLGKWQILSVIFLMVIIWLSGKNIDPESYFGVMFLAVFVYIGIRILTEGIEKKMITSILFSAVWLSLVFSMIFNIINSGIGIIFIIIAIVACVVAYILLCRNDENEDNVQERIILVGFLRLLAGGEELQSENLGYSQRNPRRFYEVLPYVFALGEYQRWFYMHSSMNIEKADWIESEKEVDYDTLWDCMNILSECIR